MPDTSVPQTARSITVGSGCKDVSRNLSLRACWCATRSKPFVCFRVFVCPVQKSLRLRFHFLQDGGEVTICCINGDGLVALANPCKRPDREILSDFQSTTRPQQGSKVRIGRFVKELITGSFHSSSRSVVSCNQIYLQTASANRNALIRKQLKLPGDCVFQCSRLQQEACYGNETGGSTTIKNVATGPRRSDISHQTSPLRPLD